MEYYSQFSRDIFIMNHQSRIMKFKNFLNQEIDESSFTQFKFYMRYQFRIKHKKQNDLD